MTRATYILTATVTVTFRRSDSSQHDRVMLSVSPFEVTADDWEARLLALKAVNGLGDILSRPVTHGE